MGRLGGSELGLVSAILESSSVLCPLDHHPEPRLYTLPLAAPMLFKNNSETLNLKPETLNPKGPSTSIVCTLGAQIATK